MSEQYDELPFSTSEDEWPPAVVIEPRPCRRHVWAASFAAGEDPKPWLLSDEPRVLTCQRCGKAKDEAASRRGKNNRKRGLALQLEHARRLGLENLQGTGATDARSELAFGNAAFVAQMKSGGTFPGWMQRELDYLPRTGGRTPLLVVIETPGPGRKARALVVMDERDWIDLHVGSKR